MEVSIEAIMLANKKALEVSDNVEKIIDGFRKKNQRKNLQRNEEQLERIDTIHEVNSIQEIQTDSERSYADAELTHSRMSEKIADESRLNSNANVIKASLPETDNATHISEAIEMEDGQIIELKPTFYRYNT